MVALAVQTHPLLALQAFVARWSSPWAESSPPWLSELLGLDANSPLGSDDSVRTEVRSMLRHAGYKPSGRGKPASEYLRKAAQDGPLRSINLAVDLGNAVSLHSGLPISIVDLDRLTTPLHVRVADDDASYVFNPAGQEIRLRGLLSLHDAVGPCANAVKDAQRTKTDAATQQVLCLLWGVRSHEPRGQQAVEWFQQLCERSGAQIEPVEPSTLESGDPGEPAST